MTKPKVSVAIATLNGARYLREQLDSVYAQTWQPLEVVVSDDASTDETVSILKRYEFSRGLRYTVNPERLGLVTNFERAIAMASGDFIALCDQDDLWKPHKISSLAQAIGDATLVYCDVNEVLESDGHTQYENRGAPIARFARTLGSRFPTKYLIAENWVVSHSVLFRRMLLEHALPIPKHQRFHDGWLALVASKLGGVVYVDETLQTYRHHAQSFTFVDSRPPARNMWIRLLDGSFAANWSLRCAVETARLGDVMGLPLLEWDDKKFVTELLSFYRSGLMKGHRWRSFCSGLKSAKYFATQQDLMARVRVPLKGLLASPSASLFHAEICLNPSSKKNTTTESSDEEIASV